MSGATICADRAFLPEWNHASRLLAKLHARDRAQLVVIVYETGVVAPGTPT